MSVNPNYTSDGDSETDFEIEDNSPQVELPFTVYNRKQNKTKDLVMSIETNKINSLIFPQDICNYIRNLERFQYGTWKRMGIITVSNKGKNPNNIKYVDAAPLSAALENINTLISRAEKRLRLCGGIIE